ncbi:MAG: hypothetical protein LBQ66_02780 [Planctomycetaceae bacterium]|nr:hypothetical protein [Planctomycetaceae bacterium]
MTLFAENAYLIFCANNSDDFLGNLEYGEVFYMVWLSRIHRSCTIPASFAKTRTNTNKHKSNINQNTKNLLIPNGKKYGKEIRQKLRQKFPDEVVRMLLAAAN